MRKIEFIAYKGGKKYSNPNIIDNEQVDLNKHIDSLMEAGYKLVQFIGKRDIKGKKIYEGDIVTAKAYPFYGNAPEITSSNGKCDELNYVGVVTYCEDTLSYFLDIKKVSNRVSGDVVCLDINDYDLEVIDNIYTTNLKFL